MTIEADLRQWNGKSAHDIRTIHARHRDGPGLIDDLVTMCADQDLEAGATWLLKHHLEASPARLDPAVAVRLVRLGTGFRSWEARLHLLQMLDRLDIPKSAVGLLAQLVDACFEDRKTLVRAWSYHGLQHLARLDSARRSEILARLNRAEETEHAASAKVRLRKALSAVSGL
ncbi:MAG: hypothetical protein RIC18_12715 [Hoeflea sp.]|uniref:hypothetical protein n=1 Tax=Hoeflea sp. TaxID=1940281 RepID=UPI0032EDA06C